MVFMENTRILQQLLAAHRMTLQRIGAAWLAAGADGFGIFEDGQTVMGWPNGLLDGHISLRSPLQFNGEPLGEIGVSGLDGNAATRLEADAMLISTLLNTENEIANITQELISSQDQLLALYAFNESMRSHLEVNAVLESLVQVSVLLARGVAACTILVIPPDPIMVYHPKHFVTSQLMMQFFTYVHENPHRMLLEDAGDHGLPSQTTALIEPIFAGGEVIAVLCILRQLEEPFQSPDLKLIRAICDQAGGQIENVLLYQETLQQARLQTEMEMARDVQTRMLPRTLPHIDGLSVAAGAMTASQVGGDLYDFIHQPDQPLLFMIGDVSGKGMPAALLMSATRTLIRSKAHDLNAPTPAEIVGAVNDALYDDFTELSMFATVFIGQYIPKENVLYYANAGHSPVLFYPAGTTARLLEADSPPLGVLPMSIAENIAVPFLKGDILVLATDGFSEARNRDGELFGYVRLLQLVESLADQTADVIAAELFTAVATFSGGGMQDDDQTLIVLKGI